jgi:hypothetical protein
MIAIRSYAFLSRMVRWIKLESSNECHAAISIIYYYAKSSLIFHPLN